MVGGDNGRLLLSLMKMPSTNAVCGKRFALGPDCSRVKHFYERLLVATGRFSQCRESVSAITDLYMSPVTDMSPITDLHMSPVVMA